MLRHSFAIGLAFAVVAVLGLAGPAAAGEQVPFKGRLEGGFTVTPIPMTPTAYLVVSGAGNGTHLGKFSVEIPHVVNFVTRIGIGTYTFTAANGDLVFADFVGSSTPVEPGVVAVVEIGVITGGTGRFTGATGEFTVERLVDQIGRTTIGSFEGTISSPGAGKP
jgi:hypothetical protein